MKNTQKILALILMLSLGTLPLLAQSGTVTIHADNRPLKEVMDILQKESGYNFFYSSDILNPDTRVSVHAEREDIKSVAERLFHHLGIT